MSGVSARLIPRRSTPPPSPFGERFARFRRVQFVSKWPLSRASVQFDPNWMRVEHWSPGSAATAIQFQTMCAALRATPTPPHQKTRCFLRIAGVVRNRSLTSPQSDQVVRYT